MPVLRQLLAFFQSMSLRNASTVVGFPESYKGSGTLVSVTCIAVVLCHLSHERRCPNSRWSTSTGQKGSCKCLQPFQHHLHDCGAGDNYPTVITSMSSSQCRGAATQTLPLKNGWPGSWVPSHQLHLCHEWAVCPLDPSADRTITASCVPNKMRHHRMCVLSLGAKDGLYIQVFRKVFSDVSLKDASILITHNVRNWNRAH